MAHPQHLRAVLGHAGFGRLFAVRIAGQFGDGIFQASLAGAVLFNPEHSVHASDIASGFAVLLLPYSLVAPFAGVLLDRWWRQRVMTLANLVRGIAVVGLGIELGTGLHGEPLYVSALVIVSVNRFLLSALSASLPHVVGSDVLVTANAFSTTCGSVATTAGAAIAIGVRTPLGGSNLAYMTLAIGSAVPYLLGGFFARGFERTALGPDEDERSARESARAVARGLVAGARHVAKRPQAVYALGAVTVLRFCFGFTTVCTLLLYRNYFHSHGVLRAGLPGIAQVTVVLAAGAGAAALVTPAAARRLGLAGWSALLFVFAAAGLLGLWLPYQLLLVLAGVFVISFVGQGVQICVDTVLQASVEDAFRGRVFTGYDTLVNIAFVAAAAVTALEVPESGYDPPSIVAIAIVCAATGAIYWWFSSRLPESDRVAYQARSSSSARSAPSGP